MTMATLPLLLAQSEPARLLIHEELTTIAQRGAIAMLVGLLVGAEREYSHSEKEELFAGVRTFPLISLLGFTAGLLAMAAGSPLVFVGVTIGFCALVVASYVLTSLGEDKGATTEIAGLTVYFLGALCWLRVDVTEPVPQGSDGPEQMRRILGLRGRGLPGAGEVSATPD